jgi:hypothetical protein
MTLVQQVVLTHLPIVLDLVAATAVLLSETDPYQLDLSHYSRDCNLVDGKLVCFQRPAAPGAIKVGCVGDSITAVGR